MRSVAMSLWMIVACAGAPGSQGPRRAPRTDAPGNAALAEQSPTASEAGVENPGSAVEAPAGATTTSEPPHRPVPLRVACGRATAHLPEGWAEVEEFAEPCSNPGYPMPLRARGLVGGESLHVLQRNQCRVDVAAGESLGGAPSEAGTPTPEGTVIEVRRIDAEGTCGADPLRRLDAALAAPVTLHPRGEEVRFQISSAGHAVEGPLPPEYRVVALGGMADVFETAFRIEGPGSSWASVYTGWRGRPTRGRIRAQFLPRRIRWREGVEPWEEESRRGSAGSEGTNEGREGPCRCGHAALGPRPELAVDLYLCGAPREREALLALLTGMRFRDPEDSED